jgi:3-hydroxyisobutyrate dehydrogenase
VSEHRTTVAILGTGVMGSAMARNAARAGLTVRAWSRPLEDAERLAGDGIVVAPTAAAASAGAELVVTMVPDADAIESFSYGQEGFLDAMGPDAIWVQSSTVGVEPADRLIDVANQYGVTIVDAPVLGTKEPAERGELVMLASGDEQAIARCSQLFDAVARRVLYLGPAGSGSRMKMVTNDWIVSAVAAIAESMALAEALGLDGRRFLEAIDGAPVNMAYAQIKGGMMAQRDYPVQMTLANGLKDARLALAAARAQGLPARVIAAAAEVMDAAVSAGWSAHDMAAAFQGAVAAADTPDPGEER